MEDEEQRALETLLDSIQHMTREEMKSLLLEDANDPEYVATVEALFSQEDISHEVLVECLKEMLVPSASESLPSTSASKPQEQAKAKSSSEDEDEVRRRTKKRKLPADDEKSAESDDTVDLAPVKNKLKKQANSGKAQTSGGRLLATVDLDSSSESEKDNKKDRKGKSRPAEREEKKKKDAHSSGKEKKGISHGSGKEISKDVQRAKDKEKRKTDEKKRQESSSKSDSKERIKESKTACFGIDEKKKESKDVGHHYEDSRLKVSKSSHKDDHGEKKKHEEKSSREDRDREERKLKSKERDKSVHKKGSDDKHEKQKEKISHGESSKSSRPVKEHEKLEPDKGKKPVVPENEKMSKADDPHSSKSCETKEKANLNASAGDKTQGTVRNDALADRSIQSSNNVEEKAVKKEPKSITDVQQNANVCDLPTSSGPAVGSQQVLDIAEDTKRTVNEGGNAKFSDNLAMTERLDTKSNALVTVPSAESAPSSMPVGQKSEVCFPPEFKVRVPQAPLVDPDFRRYKKDFKLKRVKVVLYDVRKQKRDMQDGDQVHRRLLHEEERKRKKEKHKLPERKEKYSERGTRILPFEKRPENADIYARKREIVREKPKTETPTEKQKRLVELHKLKEREKEEKKKAAFHSEFRIPKGKKDVRSNPNIVENIISSTTTTPLAPPVKVNKMHFDKRRITTTTAKEESWGLTPEEKAALEKMDKVKHKKYDEPVFLDDGLCDFDVHLPEGQKDLFPAKDERAAEDDEQDSGCYPPSDTPPLPIKECEVNDLSRGVIRLLFTETCIELADENASHADVIMQKCGKWFRGVEHEPYYQTCPSIPEQNEEEYYTLMDAAGDDNDSVSSVGNVSNPDGEDDLQDNEITSTAMDPDQQDEFCGAALLNAKLRVKPGDTSDCFKNILEVRRGLNYDKANFQAKCNLCEEQIADKRHLGAHIRSSKHRINLAETSLTLIGMSGKPKTDELVISSPTESKTSDKVDYIRKERKEKERKKNVEEKDGLKSQNDKERVIAEPAGAISPRRIDARRHRSRSRSKSPRKHRRSRSRSKGRRRSRSRDRRSRSRSRGRRSRSRSPHRRNRRSRSRSYSPRGRHHRRSKSRSPGRLRRHSRDRKDESSRRVERKRSRSPKVTAAIIQKLKDNDNAIFKEKLMLEASGKWTNQLESRWKLKEEEEEKMKRFFEKKRKNLEERPEEHASYSDEWTKFWERRYQELTEQGKDAESYDYIPEWKLYWKDFSDNLLDNEYAIKMQEVRKKYGMDLETLRALNAASAPPPATPPAQHTVPHVPVFPYGMPPPPPMVPPPMVPLTSIPTAVLGSTVPVMPLTPLPPTCLGPVAYPSAVPQLGVQSNVAVVGSSSNATPVNLQNIVTDSTVPTVSGRGGVDYTTKSMSISSGSSNGKKPAAAPTANVTLDDVKNTWLNLTGQKISAAVVEAAKSVASNGSSGKSQGFDYDGLDVVQTLRLMLNLEDELSFLAPEVQKFYQEAEKLEKEETRKSFNLLKNEDFALLLKQCRDRFHSILRANVSSSEVMKKLNFATFALNALLESSACQKLRSTVPIVEKPEVPSSNRPTSEAVKVQVPSADVLSRAHRNPIADALQRLPQRVLADISSVIASSLIAQGKDRLSESEITTNLLSIFAPILAGSHSYSSVKIPILSPTGSNVSIASLHSDHRIETAPTGFKSETGSRTGAPPVSTSRVGGLEDEVGYGMSSFLPGHGGGTRFGRNGPNPHNQDDRFETIIQNISFAKKTNEPGLSSCHNLNPSLEHSSQENQGQKFIDPVKEFNKNHNAAGMDGGGVFEEPYDPEVASFSSGEILDVSENVQAVSSGDRCSGPCLPPGILSLIQKEREAKTGVESSTGHYLEHGRPESKSGTAFSSRLGGTSSLSSVTEVGMRVAKRSKRHRRKSKNIKEGTKHKRSRSRKKQGRHSRSPSISPEGEDLRRRLKKSRQDRMTRRSLSPVATCNPHAASARRHSRDEDRRRRREGPTTSSAQHRTSRSSEIVKSRSRRHRRSKKKKRCHDQSGDGKIAGVSKHFWNDNGSSISSEDKILDITQETVSKPGGVKPCYRRTGSGALVGMVEDGEVISSSETDFSNSSVSQQQTRNEPHVEPIEVVSEEENWGDDHVSHV